MFPYSTNNPQYFQYVASTMTRAQIKADPYWCQVLDNPFLGDNLELAIRFEEAETGDFEDKKNFVEFFFANGPELDADTLCFWRREILLNPVYTGIANTYYSNIPELVEIREQKYNKSSYYTDKNGERKKDCFKNPCDYIGPFSVRIGYLGDQAFNAATTDDVMAAERLKDEMRGDPDAFAPDTSAQPAMPSTKGSNLGGLGALGSAINGFTSGLFAGDTKNEPVPYATDNTDGSTDRISGRVPRCYRQYMVPVQQRMYDAFCCHYSDLVSAHSRSCHERLWKKGVRTQSGDPNSLRLAKYLALLEQANTRRHLGDCQRIWDQMKMLNVYDPSQNLKYPIPQSDITGGQKPNGTPQAPPPSPVEASVCPPSVSRRLAAEQGKKDPNDNRKTHVIKWSEVINPQGPYYALAKNWIDCQITADILLSECQAIFDRENPTPESQYYNQRLIKGDDWPKEQMNKQD